MTTATEIDLSIPLRPCEPWCEDGDMHGDQHPVDRACWSPFEKVRLTAERPIKAGDQTWWFDNLNVHLRRRPRDEVPVIYLHHEGDDTEVILTLAEAADLADAVIRLLALAGGAS